MPNKISLNNNYPDITKSDELYRRALGLIPSVTQTLAKGPGQHIKGIAPKYLVKGKGSHVWDADGNEYIDFNMGIGPLSLGYANDKVDEAIREQLKDGITFSLMHPLEVEVAEMLREIIPNAEAVRYSKTGADVTSAAVRLARAFTGKEKVLCCGYHGWHDWYISVTDRNKGIPNDIKNLTFTFSYNDIQSVKDSIDSDTACIILEPFVFEAPKNDFLQQLREVCN
jgi:glutamate-1-semialdehyde aminotransferase